MTDEMLGPLTHKLQRMNSLRKNKNTTSVETSIAVVGFTEALIIGKVLSWSTMDIILRIFT